MHRQHWKRAIAATLTGLATTTVLGAPTLFGQTADTALSVPAGLQNVAGTSSGPIQYLQFAHFNIPFDVDASGPPPREVHLWVSPDQGRSWLKYASTTPDKRAFEFHAAAEGEYLFAVQTKDGQGASALAASPPMRVMIDTTRPELQVSADVSTSGRLVIDYQISDAFLVEDSIRLAYSADGQSRWEEIRADSPNKAGNGWSGRCEIDMPRCRELDVRLTATDLAQNSAEKVFRFSAPRTAAASAGMQLASQRGEYPPSEQNLLVAGAASQPPYNAQRYPLAGPVGAPPRIPAGPQLPPTISDRPDLTSSRRVAPAPASPAAVPLPQPGVGLVGSQGGVAWNPSEGTTARSMSGWTTGLSPTATARTVAAQPGSTAPAATSQGARIATAPPKGYEELPPPSALEEVGASAASELQLSTSTRSNAQTSENSAGQPVPVTRQDIAAVELDEPPAPATSVPTGAPPTAPSLEIERPSEAATAYATPLPSSDLSAQPSVADGAPASINDAYHSRSRAFSLDYAVDSLRGAAVSDIELWGTEDQGRTWQKWGSDPDRQSPFDVQVGNDGLFGFRMVIIGANGLISNRPQSGDPADMWINVDTHVPSVKITRALYGEGEQAASLVIEFDGTDDNMHERPITLSYSERPTGPWTTIAGGLANNGQYLWKPAPGLPSQVFLRAQAVDRAGNTQEHRLELPVSLRGLTPHGRIQGFRPIDAN